MQAPANLVAKKLVNTYMEYLNTIAKDTRFRAGKYGHLNVYIDNDQMLRIGAGVTLNLLLCSNWEREKVARLQTIIGARIEYERWLQDPYWQNSYHLKGLGVMCAGDLTMSAIKAIMLSTKFKAAVEHYKPMQKVEKRAIGKFFLETFCEATKMAMVKSYENKTTNKWEHYVEHTQVYYEFIDRWKQIRVLFALRNMPTTILPTPWTSFMDGGYQTIVTQLSKVEAEEWPLLSKNLKLAVVNAINKLQAQPFQIDSEMVDLVTYLKRREVSVGNLISSPPMPRPVRTGRNMHDARQWMAYAKSRRSNGERSSYVQWRVSLDELARRDVKQFWFVHYMDRRGRVYLRGGQMGYQAQDYKRQSLLFPGKAPVKGHEQELMYAVSNAAGKKGLWGSALEQWFGTEMERLTYCGSNPEGTVSIWSGMKEPFRYIRLARLWAAYVNDNGVQTGIPFQLDQTTSGYGHVSCLVRDAELARITNVIGDGYGDLYTHLGKWTLHVMRMQLEKELDDKKIKCYQWWLNRKPERTLYKRMFMPLIYGSGYETMDEAVVEYMKNEMSSFTERGIRLKDLSTIMASSGWVARRMVLPQVTELSKWLTAMAKAMIAAGHKPHWHSPLGLRVESYHHEVAPDSTCSYVMAGKTVILNQHRNVGLMPSHGMAADFVHSYDSAFLQQFVSVWPHQIVTVHDCFATTIDKVAIMRAELRDQWSRFYAPDHLSQLHGYVSVLTGCNLPPPPRTGTLLSSSIGENHWLFS